ncbi:MAG: response regulator transcription factor [candidate division NC10 bacterium]|nr:response regulator transcription factor [candidate division NC10 bacterium]
MRAKVLVVDDEQDILDLVRYHLEREGYQVVGCRDGKSALDLVGREKPDLVVLDLLMPGVDGFEVCRRLRRESSIPIVMLTAKADETDTVVGLELGADDYVTKPFSPRELVARVRAVLRRGTGPADQGPLTIGALAMDFARYQVRVGGTDVVLTAKEMELLKALVQARGRVLSRDFLLERVWGYDRAAEIESRTVDVHVRRLREKLGREARRIVTVKGVGYRFDNEG